MTREQHWAEFKRLSVTLVQIAFEIATAETPHQRAQKQWVWNATSVKRSGHMRAALAVRS